MLAPFSEALWKLGNIIGMLLRFPLRGKKALRCAFGNRRKETPETNWRHAKPWVVTFQSTMLQFSSESELSELMASGKFLFRILQQNNNHPEMAWVSLFSPVHTKDGRSEARAVLQLKPPELRALDIKFLSQLPLFVFRPRLRRRICTKNSDDAVFTIIIFLITHSCLLLHNKRLLLNRMHCFIARRYIQPE